MNLFGFDIRFGKPKVARSRSARRRTRDFSAKYDAAQTNHMNKRHWANADSFSADQANAHGPRRLLVERSRYEIANNAYLGNIVTKTADAVNGTGARFQFRDSSARVNKVVQEEFSLWFEATGMAEKLRITTLIEVSEGESFMVEKSRPNEASPINLDYELVDNDRCTNTALIGFDNERNIDGVILDEGKRPIAYEFLRQHPGSAFSFSIAKESVETIPAHQVIHFFRSTRPEQHRGVPEIVAALEMGAKNRSFSLSTVEAARVAATFSGVLHTAASEYDDEDTEGGTDESDNSFNDFDEFGLSNGMFLTLPAGYDMRQVKAEHPNSTHKDFKRDNIAEMAQSIGTPVNVALGDSSGFNFASGRLDRLSWRKDIKIRQKEMVRKKLNRIFLRWLREAILIEGLLPQKVRRVGYRPKMRWYFDGDAAIDPTKEATADAKNLLSRSTTHADIYAEKGKDWREEYAQIAEEKDERERLGITFDDLDAAAADIPETAEEPQPQGEQR